jgi:hypothetical protein
MTAAFDWHLVCRLPLAFSARITLHSAAWQRLALHGEILVKRGDACVAVEGHFIPIASKTRPENRNVSECRKQPN